jgi:biopolymer transport protein ExbD
MQFTTRRKRPVPAVIIVALIDVLIVVLIFLMVTTTFKQQPALKLALPESNQPKTGATVNAIIVTIGKNGVLYFNKDPVIADALQRDLIAATRGHPEMTVAINADTDAPLGQEVKVLDAAKAANIKSVSLSVRSGAAR